MTKRPLNPVVVLYVEYLPTHRLENLKVLEGILNRVFPGHPRSGYVISNSKNDAVNLSSIESADDPAIEAQKLMKNLSLRIRSGDNSDREFSGWQKGIDLWRKESGEPEEKRELHLGIKIENEMKKIERERVNENTIFCLCNDTFPRNYGSQYLNWFSRGEVNSALERGQAVGYVDRRHQIAKIFGLPFERWLRTSFFLISWRQLKKVLPLSPLPEHSTKIFETSGSNLFLETAPLTHALRCDLERWLVIPSPDPQENRNGKGGEGNAKRIDRETCPEDRKAGLSPEARKGRWHSAEALNSESRSRLQGKANSILLELFFSARLQNKGITLFDVRRSRARALGLFWFAHQLGLLDRIQSLRHHLAQRSSASAESQRPLSQKVNPEN